MILLLEALAFMSAFKHYSHQGFIGMEPEETPTPPTGAALLLESGFYLLLESGGHLLLE